MIVWNKVTWYSKLAAIIVFVGTFAVAFWLGRAYEMAKLSPALDAQNVPQTSDSNPPPGTSLQLAPGTHIPNGGVINNVIFACPDGKDIHAIFYENRTVHLDLSDGRSMNLPQTISASGARYANADESFVFWNKGSGAFIEERGTTTYKDCAIRPSGM